MEERTCETCCYDEKGEDDYPCNECSHNHANHHIHFDFHQPVKESDCKKPTNGEI